MIKKMLIGQGNKDIDRKRWMRESKRRKKEGGQREKKRNRDRQTVRQHIMRSTIPTLHETWNRIA